MIVLVRLEDPEPDVNNDVGSACVLLLRDDTILVNEDSAMTEVVWQIACVLPMRWCSQSLKH